MTKDQSNDNIFAERIDRVSDFRFDDSVARVFDDMIRRSVPGYQPLLRLIGLAGNRYVQPYTNCYDLGCSLGGVSLMLQQTINASGTRIVAVDNSSAMVERCRRNIELSNNRIPVEVIEADIDDIKIENASLVVMNFTLQFLPSEKRDGVIQKIFDGLKAGGIFILSEKIRFEENTTETNFQSLYLDFKRQMGYSDLEISQKRTALEKVLRPDTKSQHTERLKSCGFSEIDQWFQSLLFCSFIARKS